MRETEQQSFDVPGVSDPLVVEWEEGAGPGRITVGDRTLVSFVWLDELEGERVLEIAPGIEVTLTLRRSPFNGAMSWPPRRSPSSSAHPRLESP